MTRSTLFFLSLLSLSIGIIVCAIQYEWIVIRFWQPIIYANPAMHVKKKLNLHYWNTNRWHKESEEFLWTKNSTANLEALIACWLAIVNNEQITPKKISIQTVMITPSKEDALISFDRCPFSKSWSIQKKLMLIEGLLKTVRENEIPIKTMQFLIDHQPINDQHLDFSHPWPINGFIKS